MDADRASRPPWILLVLLALPLVGAMAFAVAAAGIAAMERAEHRRGFAAALIAGDAVAAQRHGEAIRDASPNPALNLLLTTGANRGPLGNRALRLAAVGDWDRAARLMEPLARAFPEDLDARETLRAAREHRIAAWQDDLRRGAEREDWLAVERALAGLAAASPGDDVLATRLRAARNGNAPVALARDRALWLTQADGTTGRMVTDAIPVARPVWSPDRTRIAFVSTDPYDGRAAGTLYVVPLDGGEPREVYPLAHPNAVPSWSPDGSAVALTSVAGWNLRRETGQLTVRIVDVATGANTDVSGSADIHGMSPVWSPTGDAVAFIGRPMLDDARASPLSGPADVWVWSAGDGRPRRLSDAVPGANRLLWSPDGTSLVALVRERGLPGQGGSIAASIHLLDPETGNVRPLASGISAATSSWAPAWSPDGAWLAWVDSPGDVVLQAVDGRERRIVVDRFLAGSITWSPGGESLLAPAADPSEPAARIDEPTSANAAVHRVEMRYDTEWPTGAPQWGPVVAAPVPRSASVGGAGLDAEG